MRILVVDEKILEQILTTEFESFMDRPVSCLSVHADKYSPWQRILGEASGIIA